MKIYELANKNLFEELNKIGTLTFVTSENFELLDLEYFYNHSGEKYLSPLFEKLQDNMPQIAKIISLKFKDKWNRLYETYYDSDYDILTDYKIETQRESKINTNIDISISGENKEQTTSSVSQEDSVYGFNSTSAVPSSTKNSNTNQNAEQTSTSEQVTSGSKEKNNTNLIETQSGKKSDLTYSEMLLKEIRLREEFNFYEILYRDLDSVLCLAIY